MPMEATDIMRKAISENILSVLVVGILLLQVALSAALLFRVNALTEVVNRWLPGPLPGLGDVRVKDVSADDDPARGDGDAPVTIIEFADFQCPACAESRHILDEVLDACGNQVHLVFRDFPVGEHSSALQAAVAAECADQQGQFWPMHDFLFDHQQALAKKNLIDYAHQLGLDEVAFAECLASEEAETEVRHDLADGQSYGVNGTPTLFINGRRVEGVPPLEILLRLINEELAGAGVNDVCR